MFTVSTKADVIADSNGGGNYISKSGIYDVTINFASVDVSKNGAHQVNFNVSTDSDTKTIYGPYVTDSHGNALKIGQDLITKLLLISGVTDGQKVTPEMEEHVVGKDKKLVELAILTPLSGFKCKMRVQEEYSRYQGEISKKLVPKAFFTEDGASAEELVNNAEAGKRLALETEKYATNVTYRDSSKGANDAPTPEEVQAWKDAFKANASSTPKAAAATVNKPAGSLFK